ncbi:hypothetical protein EV182_003273, partial [Spiromyces aspiralis]
PKALEMIQKWYKWRQDERIDQLPIPFFDNDIAVPCPIRDYHCLNDANLMPGNGIKDYVLKINNHLGGGCWHKTDKDGRPVYIMRVGRFDTRKITKYCTTDELLQTHYILQEFLTRVLLPECSSRAGREIDQQVNVFDCSGLSFSMNNLPAISMLQDIQTLLSKSQLYYPERMHKIYIVNAPSVFVTIWHVIKGWINPRVIGKIEILNSKDFASVLLKQIPESNLPEFLGGCCRCSHMPGGCVPCPPLRNYPVLPRVAFADMKHRAELSFETTSHQFYFKTPPHTQAYFDLKEEEKSRPTSVDNTNRGWVSFGGRQSSPSPSSLAKSYIPPVVLCCFSMIGGRGVVVEARFKSIGTLPREELLYPETLFDAFRGPTLIEIYLPEDEPEGELTITWRIPRFDEGEAPFPTEGEAKIPTPLHYDVGMEEEFLSRYDLPPVNRNIDKKSL